MTLKLCITRKNTTRRHEEHNGARNTYLIPHTSYLIPHTLGMYTYTYTTHHAIPYLTLPTLYKNIKHLTTAPSSSLDGTTTSPTPTVLGTSQYKPPYLPTHPPTYLSIHLICKGGERGVLYKIFYKSGRHQSHSQLSLASTINRPAPVESGSPSNIPYVDKVP